MKTILLALAFVLTTSVSAQKYSTYYHQRASLFESLPTSPKDIIMLGNSITDGAEWTEIFDNKNVKNRGISADISIGVYDRLDAIVKGKPAKIFLLIGVNDMGQNTPADTIIANIRKIVEKVQLESPKTRFYIQSLLPVNPDLNMFQGHTSQAHLVAGINKELENLAKDTKVTYVDLYTKFVEKGTHKLDVRYTNDGLHLLGDGYLLWRDILLPYINE